MVHGWKLIHPPPRSNHFSSVPAPDAGLILEILSPLSKQISPRLLFHVPHAGASGMDGHQFRHFLAKLLYGK